MIQSSDFPKVPQMPEVSITVMRPSGETLLARQGIQQLGSKDCLVCGRTYRYSHNARRHELTSHGFDRYTNKVVAPKKPTLHMQPKLRPNPFNPKARLMPNPINHKMQLLPKSMPTKMIPHKVIPQPRPIPKQIPIKPVQNNLPYPLRIKALKDLQIKKKEPQILKTLLTSKPEVLVSEPEIINSEPESPETLISEPEIASFQVETILSEPDAFDQPVDDQEMEGYEEIHKNKTYDTVDMDSDNEIEIAREQEGEGDDLELNDSQENEDLNEVEEGNEIGETNEIEGVNEIDGKISDPENNDCEKEDERSDNEKEHNKEEDIDEDEVNNKDEVNDTHESEERNIYNKEVSNTAEEENKIDDEQDRNPDDNEYYEDDPPLGLAPVVEINEDVQNHSSTSEVNEEDEEETEETADSNEVAEAEEEKDLDLNKQFVTKTQRDFISKYRNIIEQINTKRCLCCSKEYPRRKAVIQHLQKNGHKVPKHTCYNCVVTFGHIGALLSHMRANVCTNLWKIIYNENGVTDDMIIEGEPRDNKSPYKDIINARSYACKICHAKFQLKQFILKHVLDVHEDGQSMVPLSCVHCGSRFKDKNLTKKHTRNGECTVYIACDLCSEKFMTMQEFTDHALSVHVGNADPSNDSQAKNIDGRPTDCPLCGKKHSNYPNLVKHLKAAHNEEKPHHCQHCDAKFEQTVDLNKHIYIEHSNKTLTNEPDVSIVKEETEEYHYSCTECNAIFETVDAWTDHQVAEHNQVAHHCDQCEKKFLRPSELAEHKNTHLRVKFYPCSVCTDSYSTPQKLSEHVKETHPGATSFVFPDATEFFCDICIRSFKSRQAYSNHMRIHAKTPKSNRKSGDNKGFAPQIIGKPIKQLFSNQLTPGTFLPFKGSVSVPNAPYSCDICGKGFMHKKNIWKHKKVLHADLLADRNNDSEENTMHASTEDDEYNHEENGTGLTTPQFNSFNFTNFSNNSEDALPYSCELCFKRFPLRTSLWKHKRAKHGIINVSAGTPEVQSQATSSESGGRSSCTICKITFADKKSYYRHRKNVHKSNVQMCKICGKPLNSTLELYEHLKAAHARELLGYNANQGNSKAHPETQQSELEIDYDGDQDANDPSAEYQARYPCDTCGKQFVGLLALQNHQCLNQMSSQPQTFDCEICHKSYTSIAALKSHRGWHLRSPDGKAAANNSGLWMPQHKVTAKMSKHEVVDAVQLAHVSMPTTPAAAVKRRLPPEVEVTVVNPNKKMRSDDSIEYDPSQSLQGGQEDRYCTICDKEFTKRAAYQRHMDEVHRPNSVFCPVCDKSFTRKSTLLVHMRKHYGDEEGGGAGGSNSSQGGDAECHACDLCGAQYGSGKALRAHRARHHGEDSADSDDEGSAPPPGEFTCAQCGDGVATPRDLLAHRTMHATPSKFYCDVCKVYFSRGPELAAHTRLRHSEKEKVFFPCAMCDRFYMNKKSLQRHIEMAH